MKERDFPEHLKSTYRMLEKGFDGNLDESTYFSIIYYLYEYMSDRNLAEVLSYFTKKDIGVTYNDVLGVGTRIINPDIKSKVKKTLDDCGYEQWINAE